MYEFIHVWDETHPIFAGPSKVKVETEELKPPAFYDYREFKGRWKGPTMPVLRAHKTTPGKGAIPWGYAIYDDGGLADSPETELICGGVTGKGPSYYSILRQGRYLLWGFSPTPDDFTAIGEALFINCVHYLSKFAADEPLVRKINDSRKRIINTIELTRIEKGFMWLLERDLTADVLSSTGKDLDKLATWYRENESWLHPVAGEKARMKLDVDAVAKELRTANDQVESLGQWIDLLETAKSESALALLRRYAPEDLGAAKAPWKRWFDENRPYLFFCDSAGFKFFLDVRARQAKAPIKEFRTRKP